MNIKLENAGSLFADKVEGWWELIVKMVPNLILAIVVSVLFALWTSPREVDTFLGSFNF
jgi:hypothetical protein